MSQVKFTVPGLPVGQPRHRVAVRSGGRARAYIPRSHPVHEYKARVALVARRRLREPLTGPIGVRLVFVVARSTRDRVRARWAAKKPDLDNLVKAVLDALEGIAFENDRQIVQLSAKKLLAAKGTAPCTRVQLCQLE